MSRREQTRYVSRSFFLKKIIREYYGKRPLEEPTDLHKREIALESLEDGVYIRHLSFPFIQQLYEYILRSKTPLHLYYSSALYAYPSAEKMENKNWEGSELIFDIDADKYPGCEQRLWICSSTGELYTSEIESCPNNEKPVEYISVPWSCISRAWRDVQVLVDVLREDFGYKMIKVYFSGNRGFHIRVLDNEVLSLTREDRKAIADYISCEGLNRDRVFPVYKDKILMIPPEYGLRRRVYEQALERGLLEKTSLRKLRDVYALSAENLEALLSDICIKIDKAVTMDISRLSRFGNSLNMKAGLKVTEMDLNRDVESLGFHVFSPFKGFMRIKSSITANLSVLDRELELVRGNEYRVEAYLGLYLVVKNIAHVVDSSELEVRS